ncbi:M48 family metalloprotease [Pseudaestuariivita rosea]|uniref:M48 family metalloprotease n=1 Tax=Pseudaestuariivita rosea TaxID=2763263 RepID=UPI001ABB083E|nr:M48 family metalloprotease [Pseudaestuariivita rosea]
MHRFFIILFLIFTTLATTAMARSVTFLRDAEVERGLDELARPILLAAGLNPSSVKIVLIDDESLNAFVIDGRAIFLHSGLVMRLERPEELQAVIAHEAAHIANGHLTRRVQNFRNSRMISAAALGLAVAAGAAGADPDAAGGFAVGASSSANRVFLAHTRNEESSADRAGIRYMVAAGIDPTANISLLEIFRGQEALSAGRQDPYSRTHPLNSARIRDVKAAVAAYEGRFETTREAQYWFNVVQGKLSAFKRSSRWTLRKVRNQTDNVSTMRRAVAYHLQPDARRAVAEIDKLIAKNPRNPYAHELKGLILHDNRQFNAAAQSYRRAVDLSPNQPLILAGYGRTLLAIDTRDSVRNALSVLEKSRSRDPYNARVLRDLAVAYAKTGQNGMASLATAERYALQGRMRDASVHAKRASDLLPNGSASWQRAMDVLRAASAAEKQRNRG